MSQLSADPKNPNAIKLVERLKNIDSFSHPIHLTYRGQSSIKTLAGGILTFLFTIMMVFYCIYRVNMVVTRGDNKLYEVSFIRNLEADGQFFLKDSEFKFIV